MDADSSNEQVYPPPMLLYGPGLPRRSELGERGQGPEGEHGGEGEAGKGYIRYSDTLLRDGGASYENHRS